MLDAGGVFGQVARVGQLTSEVILVSDAAHAIPVQINRNGLRTVAVGTGDTGRLKLPYLPTSADVVVGDLLVTSGLGGGFPAGYPVGTVAEVKRDPAQSLADVDVKPAAALDRSRELMFVWLKPQPPRRIAPRTPRRSPLPGAPDTSPGASPKPPPRSTRQMMRETRIRRLPMALSALVALALAVVPLPAVLDAFRPDFLVLVVFYWSHRIAARRRTDAGVLVRPRARCDPRRGARAARAGAHLDGAPGPRICGCACGCSRCCRNA